MSSFWMDACSMTASWYHGFMTGQKFMFESVRNGASVQCESKVDFGPTSGHPCIME